MARAGRCPRVPSQGRRCPTAPRGRKMHAHICPRDHDRPHAKGLVSPRSYPVPSAEARPDCRSALASDRTDHLSKPLDTLRRFADAPLGMGVVRSLAVIAIAGWLGIMAFVSFGVAPRIFRALDRAVAGEAVAAILPRYYDWELVLCGVALAGCVFQVLAGREGWLRPLIGAALCGLMCGLLAWASTVALPRAEAARRARDDAAFARAHRASVRVNSATMVTAAAFLALETLSLAA